MELWFPGLVLHAIVIRAGCIWEGSIAGIVLRMPPFDIHVWGDRTLWAPFKIFDSAWILGPILDFINAAQDYLGGRIDAVRDNLNRMVPGLGDLMAALATLNLSALGDQISKVKDGLLSFIWGWVDGSLRWLSDTFRWLHTEIKTEFSTAKGDIVRTVLGGFLDVINDLLTRIPEAIWIYLQNILDEMVIDYYERKEAEAS